MKAFREILFPSDFSPAVTRMAPYAREMAERFHAHVTVVHACEFAPPYAMAPHLPGECEMDLGPIPYTPEFQQRREELQRRLEEFANTQFARLPHTAKIEDGDPATVIEWMARRDEASIIVMPTTGRGRFRRLLLGSVTAKVLHDIPCPILTSAHQPDAALGAIGGFHSMLCAIEMNREADEILDAGGFLAGAYAARLCLVHMESASSKTDLQDAAHSVKQSFQEALTGYEHAGVKASVRVIDASVPEGIRRTAIEEGADLVIVGRGRLRGALARLWSPLYTIISESPCPVLSV
jgi:nucleotide-binding universal stress UspA family protein